LSAGGNGFLKNVIQCLLLPGGEGRGEGERKSKTAQRFIISVVASAICKNKKAQSVSGLGLVNLNFA